jgi:prophage antirepressor-like protein
MQNQVQIFENKEFGQIRTVEIRGQVWFVGKDIADVLAYGNYRQALKTNVDEEVRVSIQWTPPAAGKT